MGESFHGCPLADERNEFLEQTRQARLKRTEDVKRDKAALAIQTEVRAFLAKKRFRKMAVERFVKLMEKFSPEDATPSVKARDVFQASSLVMKMKKSELESNMLEKLCRYVIWSMSQSNAAYSYIGCGLNKETAVTWIQHLKDLVICCLRSLTKLKPELVSDSKAMSLFLTTLISITSLDRWQILQGTQFANLIPGMKRLNSNLIAHIRTEGKIFECMHTVLEAGLARPGKFFIKKANLLAISKLSLRAVKVTGDEIDEESLHEYIINVLTVPAYVYYVNSMCPEGLDMSLIPHITTILNDRKPELIDDSLSKTLSLLGNLVQLGQNYDDLYTFFYPNLQKSLQRAMEGCKKQFEAAKKNHWHPILGWVEQPVPSSMLNAATLVKQQIEYLWGNVYFDAIFRILDQFLSGVNMNTAEKYPDMDNTADIERPKPANLKASIVKAFRKVLQLDSNPHREPYSCSMVPSVKYNPEIGFLVSENCQFINSILKTFHLFRLDILTGVCFKQSSKWLVSLWKFIQLISRDAKMWVETLLSIINFPQETLLVIFADAMVHYITMLDDQEMYEDQHAFKLDDFVKLARFTNHLCYRLIASPHAVRLKDSTWNSLQLLLLVLYRRDCRRKYCPDGHWSIDSTRMIQLLSDFQKGKKIAKRVLVDMPHVLKEEARVILFRKWAASEKTLNGNSAGENEYGTLSVGSTLITIQRGRIVEDGYAQLASLSPKALKGTIRVRFQNELGLDEAGIDQDGVFKEFLEETINAVFNPSLNLFKATNENLLYPSPLSYLHENHLQLFEFVGKMLAKAIYEGIVVDVHFASFFLSQILGYQQNALFSAIDELQSLDRELHSSLNYIKHYEGNIEDLELTFSVDQDCLGEIRTTELIPGGRSIAVTNQNKISYLYVMAHFHLYVQIKDQTAAFLRGFRSIIPNEWIRIFSPPELQRLISGEDTDIDLYDLRRHTQYYGGFHDNHRVVVWLWEILLHDFVEHERRQFLKFVTSCSKPPLLGFSNLDPPFSIRCVEVSDDEDTGDTIGSVLRGFLTIGRKDPVGRLPTSSTCFNLLKLPNYQKKSTLREKLRYAITSNVGFELS